MKNTSFLVSLGLLTLVVSCGQDVSSNRKKAGTNTPIIQGITIEDQTNQTARSQMIREKGSPSLSAIEEIKNTLLGSLSASIYRSVPLMEKDAESGENVTTVDNMGRPSETCGVGTFDSITARIQNCLKLNDIKAKWEGDRYGSAGESTWQLVMRQTSGEEVWIDSRTGMAWSHLVEVDTNKLFNWCKASGNAQSGKGSIDCSDIGDETNLCKNLTTDLGSQVKWRLPTRNDFLQADLNGLRFVHKKETDKLWTATMKASATNHNEAWIYSSKEGTLSSGLLSDEHQVRCIGVPKR